MHINPLPPHKLHSGAFNNAHRMLSQVRGTSVQTGLSAENSSEIPKATTFVSVNGIKREIIVNYFMVDDQFIPVLNIKLLGGRNLSAGRQFDKREGFIVNEAFVWQAG